MPSGPFERLIRVYLDNMQQVYRTALSGEATPELSYRPPLDEFFRAVPGALGLEFIEVIYEPKKQDRSGRPDWRFHQSTSMGVFGYVEAKSFSPEREISWHEHAEQLNKYLQLNHNIILTDGIEFVFFFPHEEEEPRKLSIVDKPLETDSPWSEMEISIELENEFRKFFHQARSRNVSDDILMSDLAKRARNLSDDIYNLVRLRVGEGLDEQENRTISALYDLKRMLQGEHDPELKTEERFSKAVAQVLIFGLFYAHRYMAGGAADPSELKEQLHNFWTEQIRADNANRLRPFRALSEILGESEEELSDIKLWYSDCIYFLSYISLTEAQQRSPNYHHLYEEFLNHFDPSDRIDFGAYSTPKEIAEFMVRFSDAIAIEKFCSELFSTENKLIDPCCGTGTFQEECLELAREKGIGNESLPLIAGFEILPAPYALAQYRLFQLQSIGVPNADKVIITLCNSLSDYITNSASIPIQSEGTNVVRLLREERNQAAECARPPITLVIGNPPSSDAGLHTNPAICNTILSLINDFRPPDEQRTGRQNIQKQVQNDYVKFLRWAGYKLCAADHGILAFVVPSSFLQHISYSYARRWLLENFSDLWVIDFDSDARTGVRVSNVFPTLQGRCIIFCSRKADNYSTDTVKYLSILDFTKTEKLSFFRETSQSILANRRDYEVMFDEITPDPENYLKFIPPKPYDREKYSSFWALASTNNSTGTNEIFVFKRHSSGLKLGITAALIHQDINILKRRTRDLGSRISYDTLIGRWFEGQRKPPTERNLTASIRQSINDLISEGGDVPNIKRYSYRPFMNLFAFLPEGVLMNMAGSGGGGTRYRPEVLAAYSDPNNFGIAVAPAPVDIGEKLKRFATFSWHIPDNDLCSRGNAHVFCQKFPEYKQSQTNWDPIPISNINSVLIAELTNIGANPDTVEKDIVFYVYAVLVSNVYLDEFEGALYSTAGNWPRIPFPSNCDTFEQVSLLGKALAELEKSDGEIFTPSKDSTFSQFEGKEFSLKEYKIDNESKTITLVDEENKTYTLTDIDRECLSYTVSGYQVILEWLKRYSSVYLRRKIIYEDFKELFTLIVKIKKQFDLIERIDIQIKSLLESGDGGLLSNEGVR